MAKRVLIVLAEGFEEIEAITPADVLRRAGLEVVIAGLEDTVVTGSHGITVRADILLQEAGASFDAIVLPGGLPGAENLSKSEPLRAFLEKSYANGKHIGAICAAPALVLASTTILKGRSATCYPGFEEKFDDSTRFSSERVVIDSNVTTSRGPGTAMEFALSLVQSLIGGGKATELADQMLVLGERSRTGAK